MLELSPGKGRFRKLQQGIRVGVVWVRDGSFNNLTPWPPLHLERGKRGQGVKGVRLQTCKPADLLS